MFYKYFVIFCLFIVFLAIKIFNINLLSILLILILKQFYNLSIKLLLVTQRNYTSIYLYINL